MSVIQSYREIDVVLNENAPTEIYFRDTEPNHIVFTNSTSNTMYISTSANVNQNLHDLQVPSGGTKTYAKPKGMKRVYVWHASNQLETIHVVSFFDTFTPQSVSQTQETVNTQQVSGTVDVASMPALPGGTSHIGEVSVNELPSLPAGTSNIGKVDVNSLPNVEQIGFSYQQVIGVAGDNTVKPTSGKIAGIRGVGTVNLILKDGGSQIWDTIPGGTDFFFPFPIQCNTSIVLNFDVPGTAYIIYK